MSHLQANLGDTRRPQLGSSPFFPSPLFYSQLVKEGAEFPLKTGTTKNTQAFRPNQNQPFHGPHHNRKRGSYRKHPYWGQSTQAITNRFPQAGGNQIVEAIEAIFDLTKGAKGVVTLLPNDYLASNSPPVGGHLCSLRRDLLKEKCSNNMLNIITNGSVLPFILKPKLARIPLIHSGYKAHQKDLDLTSCIQSLLTMNTIERVENVKSLGFTFYLFLVPKPHQRWRPVIDLNRLNSFLVVETFKMETPESIRASLIPGEWVMSMDLSDAPYPHAYSFKEVSAVHPWFSSVPVHFRPFWPSNSPTNPYNDSKVGEADDPHNRDQTSPVSS